MSLSDALLLDPYPFETFVTYRTDSIAGSGTMNDPWNGATKWGTPVQITVLVNTGLEATGTAASSGFSNGDVVTVAGVTGDGAARWNGTFEIYGVSGNQFKYYMTAAPGAAAGLTGSTAAKVLAFPFDDVMNALPAGSRVNFGPSPPGQPFLTRGYTDAAGVSGGFQPKAGMRITGSGVDVTTLQLVPRASANAHFFAFGHALATGSPSAANPVDSLEIANLTIDCNFTVRQSVAAASGAVRLMGNGVRIARVKAINWGNNLSNHPGFVLALVTADPATGFSATDTGIEDCIAVDPATSTTGELLILHAGGKDHDALHELEGIGTCPFIRNCFVDCDSTLQLGDGTDYRAKFRGLSMSSCKGGLIEGNQIHNTWYGGPHLSQWSSREIVVRNNVFKNVVRVLSLNLPAPGTAISVTFSQPDSTALVEGSTQSDPKLAVGDRVLVSGANDSLLNGVFVVTAVTTTTPPPYKFRYMASARPSSLSGTITVQKVLGVEKLLVEGNSIELAGFKSPLERPIALQLSADTGASIGPAYVYGDVLIRDNMVRYVDGQFDPAFLGLPVKVAGGRNLIVRNNVFESAPTDQAPFQNNHCGSVQYFNNETPAGVLVQGVNTDWNNKKYDELATEAEDAFVLAYMNRK